MKTPLQSKLDLDNVSLEVKAYIYQSISEFEPFTTPATLISVISRDPLKLTPQLDSKHEDYDRTELNKMYRISISLSEDGAKLEEEGLSEDIYQAIKIAKDKLIKVLSEMQDSAISSQDRTVQINEALASSTVH